jgi:hypothetical protein
MRRHARHIAVAVMLFLSCSQSPNLQEINPTLVKDTTNASYVWRCSQNSCDVNSGPTTPAPTTCQGLVSLYTYSWRRFICINAAFKQASSEVWSTQPALCRLVACSQNSDCPQLQDSQYACFNNLCQDQSILDNQITFSEAVALCLDSSPRVNDCRDLNTDAKIQAVYQQLKPLCMNETFCTLPLPVGCRQP